MSNNNFPRIAGIAGILSAVCMLGLMFTLDQTTGIPTSSLFPVLLWGGNLAGIVFTVGLYLWYRQDVATLSLAAAAISLLGYLLFVITSFRPFDMNNPVLAIADILVYVVGVPLFSWLAYSTRKMPRPLSIVGFMAGLAGLVIYVLRYGVGVDLTNPSHPLAGVLGIFYFLYLILVLVWLVWTGYILVSGKPQPQTA